MKRQLNEIMKTIQDVKNGLTLSSWSDSHIDNPTEDYRRVCLRMSWTGLVSGPSFLKFGLAVTYLSFKDSKK